MLKPLGLKFFTDTLLFGRIEGLKPLKKNPGERCPAYLCQHVHPDETHFFRRIRVGIRVRIRVKIGCSVTENCADISKPTNFLQKPCSSAESKVFRIKLKITGWRGVRSIHVGVGVHPDETHFLRRIRIKVGIRVWISVYIRVGIRIKIRIRVRVGIGLSVAEDGPEPDGVVAPYGDAESAGLDDLADLV